MGQTDQQLLRTQKFLTPSTWSMVTLTVGATLAASTPVKDAQIVQSAFTGRMVLIAGHH